MNMFIYLWYTDVCMRIYMNIQTYAQFYSYNSHKLHIFQYVFI